VKRSIRCEKNWMCAMWFCCVYLFIW